MTYPEKLFYISIKTSTKYKSLKVFSKKDKMGYMLFSEKFNKEENLSSFYEEKGSLYPEYGVICCITLSYFDINYVIKTKTLTGDEKNIIKEFCLILNNLNKHSSVIDTLAGFKLKSFEVPYLSKKIIEYGFAVPVMLRTYKSKPWELKMEDISEVWKCHGYTHTSLLELCHMLDIDISYDDISVEKNDSENYHLGNIEHIVTKNERRIYLLTEISKKLYKTITL